MTSSEPGDRTASDARLAAEAGLRAHLVTSDAAVSEAERLVCAFVDAHLDAGATPEATVADLKRLLYDLRWPRDPDVWIRRRKLEHLIAHCIDHYFERWHARPRPDF